MKVRFILFSYVLYQSTTISFSTATIVWELETLPAVFDKDVILKCTLPQDCCKNMQSRRWLGGKDLHLLTMNGFSIDNAKYSEKFNKENKTSILIIHDFDVKDINVPYECIYGSSTFVKMLNLTEDKFEYHPSGPYTEKTPINNTDALYVSISTERVYPRPKCSGAMNGKDISLYMKTTTIMKGLFYVATITVAIVLKSGSCPGVLSITCKIGTYSYNYEKNITCNKIETDSHTGKESTTMTDLVIFAVLIVTILGLVKAACVCFKTTNRNVISKDKVRKNKQYPVEIHDEERRLTKG